jgi:RimJ/RimL family protein N-acetyltransferase
MAHLGDVPWPPVPIQTDRLVLRRTQARDRDAYVELLCSEEVYRYLGGPGQRGDLERELPEVPGNRPGVFAVDADGAFVGTVSVGRRDPERAGQLRGHAGAVEVSYLFLPTSWGKGYATEAVAALLDWVGQVLPGAPVVLCTQSANSASVRLAERLGFVEQARFVEFGAEQWFGARLPIGRTQGVS